jgi:hypothetical protein
MGLRILSLGSLVLDTMSVGQLLLNGTGSQGLTTGGLIAAATALPLAAGVAHLLLRAWDPPTTEVIRQMEGFDVNYF